MSKEILSLETERACLAALIKYNRLISDVAAFIKCDYFYYTAHSKIFSLITSTYQEKGSIDQVVLVTKLRQLGVSDIEGLDPYRYIEVLYNIPVNESYSLDYFRELVKFHFLRKTFKSLKEAETYIVKNLDKPLAEVINQVNFLITNAATANIEEDVEIVDLYGDLASELSKRAESQKEPALLTTFPVFDKWYGGIYFGDMYVFAAPAKRGKSTFLNYLSYKIAALPSNNVKVLYLDTELETWRVMCRSASSLTEINEWFFKNGKFKNDPSMVKKVHQMFDSISPVKGKVFHSYIANRPIDEIISICRRWYMKHVKPGENALIAYDYIKLDAARTGLSDHWKEYQEIGDKTDKLKKFASSLPNLAIITSIQTNANCDIAMSQQLKWYASNVYILKPKDITEYQNEHMKFGTHKLIEVATRNQGEEAKGMSNVIKVKNAKGEEEYRDNYINFKFEQFRVEEAGTLRDIISQQAQALEAEPGTGYDEGF